jgi:hypothetical protein
MLQILQYLINHIERLALGVLYLVKVSGLPIFSWDSIGPFILVLHAIFVFLNNHITFPIVRNGLLKADWRSPLKGGRR